MHVYAHSICVSVPQPRQSIKDFSSGKEIKTDAQWIKRAKHMYWCFEISLVHRLPQFCNSQHAVQHGTGKLLFGDTNDVEASKLLDISQRAAKSVFDGLLLDRFRLDEE